MSVPDEPVAVIEMPEYRRGVASRTATRRARSRPRPRRCCISPTPADWEGEGPSFYREYNEACSPTSSCTRRCRATTCSSCTTASRAAARAVFSSGAFVEGWAVYGEWLMAEHGFGGAARAARAPEDAARVAVNAILDHEIHAGTMDEKAALRADGWRGVPGGRRSDRQVAPRAPESTQLTTYFYGFLELMKIRAVAEKLPGFAEHAFHDEVLSFGAPSVHELRREVHAETPR